MSAESVVVSEGKDEVSRKSKIQIQEKTSDDGKGGLV
jgi:hypothetical protein